MLTRDDFVKFFSTRKQVAASTLKNRVAFLFKHDEARKTYLFHVIALINTKAGKIVEADARQKFQAAAVRARNKSKKQSLDNAIKNSNDDFTRWDIASDRKNIQSFARDLQRAMMLACYVYQPALRSDWSTLKITSAAVNRLDPKQNWIHVLRGGRIRLLMNDFKNAKSFGKHIIEVENVHLKRYLKYWTDLLGRLLGSKPEHLFIYQLSPVKDVILISTTREAFSKAVARNSDKIFNRPQTANSFRHAWKKKIQEDPAYQRMTQAERQALHHKLFTESSQAERASGRAYAVLSSDTSTDIANLFLVLSSIALAQQKLLSMIKSIGDDALLFSVLEAAFSYLGNLCYIFLETNARQLLDSTSCDHAGVRSTKSRSRSWNAGI
ncbi:hypothetical protein PHYSODRAFT_323634 [Phytophthora sojae]|uniref:Uncharacterized protein n=1 Tax=Phytophthora sojae (strain P6497) TaxID=1094619 RepID=G4YND4_PHYSP|nr:hypothetical protein PHYSODRAFT_323634 [Phytophthora sojae]EGZ30227.1 hypothetical protein PHYSODRAFT_323634 [Phytophthora sojae]|eukprot:XP_009517502.1 hypothetical protein PHYSODRAFT_323634 [Phytophthora sojae]